MNHRRWKELPHWQQTATLVLAPVELALTATTAMDLAGRPRCRVRGPKALWWLGIFVQPFGPVAYLVWGRIRE
ncbi:PLDc N-terminal domain-containing protein [Jidongwangia harbinensis]|uniref:PLDc N-terminal domain-containing protein n=1 Tax=Jidongwangia harbinensis TaxID=2878561 RepID=UPI001CD98D2A|nr:PLDc N-terminal domain-containing protein [Jidongwangia harbinensis]MCA2218995.1 PLD nuclease N-terminal domain-containing protein [Jidongwangia harbinensis]